MKYYRVIGECEVAGVAPGRGVTSAQLDAARAKVEFLLGWHLEEISEAEYKALTGEPKTLKAEARKP